MSEIIVTKRKGGVSISDMCVSIWVRTYEIEQLIEDLKKAEKEEEI